MANGPERYHLYVECRKCRHEIPFKEVLEPKPDDPPLTSQSGAANMPKLQIRSRLPAY
jgi:hypothetical protein